MEYISIGFLLYMIVYNSAVGFVCLNPLRFNGKEVAKVTRPKSFQEQTELTYADAHVSPKIIKTKS